MLSLSSVSNVINYFKVSCDDWVDRMHYVFTTGGLIFFATLVASSQTFGTPLQCMIGAHFPSGWSTYANSYCYVSGTFVTKRFRYGEMPDYKLADSDRIDVSYYQWIPYALIIQAVLFLIPHIFWVTTQIFSDVDFTFIMEQCNKARNQDDFNATKKVLNQVASDLYKVLKYRAVKGCHSDGLGNNGVYVYCISKLLNIINIVLQLLFLSIFIGHGRTDWGFQLLQNFFNVNEAGPLSQNVSMADAFFPRITFCYVRYNEFANVKDGTVQCLLMLNMLNEKMYAMMYAWFYVLLVVTIANLIYMLMNVLSSVGIFRSRAYLQIHNVNKYASMKFASEVLGLDGLLLLHFVKTCSGFSTASDLAHLLYEQQFSNADSVASTAAKASYVLDNSVVNSHVTLNDYHNEITHLMKKTSDSSNI